MNKIWWVKPNDLDVEQAKILQLALPGKYLILGPPGSGKSNLLVLRAKYIQQSGTTNFRVIAFTQTLVRFLRASGAVTEKKILTHTAFFDEVLYDLEARYIKEDDMTTRRVKVASAIQEHLRANRKQGLFDTLLVDEIQDYTQQELELFETIADNLFFVGDIRQQIQSSDTTHEYLTSMKDRFHVVELETHYRVGQNICELADRIAKPARGHKLILDGSQYDEKKRKSSVERFKLSVDDQMGLMATRIRTQVDAFPGEFIGVLCATSSVLDSVTEYLSDVMNEILCVQKSGDYQDFDLRRPVIVSTIHGGKGLEYRCVHIPSAESLRWPRSKPHSRELMYTAITRAKTSVSIYHEDDLHDYLEDAIKASEPQKPPPSLDSLF